MILEVWVVLMTLAIVFLTLGYFMNIDLFRIVGIVFVFLLGTIFMASGLEYKSGSTVTTVGATNTIVNNYTTYDNHTIGFYITIAGALGFVWIMLDRKRRRELYED